MPNFAVIENNIVTNVIVADSLEIAETITEKSCIEYTDQSVGIGFTYADGIFIPIKPYPSWVLNADNQWEAPIPIPADDTPLNPYMWDEESVSWVLVSSKQ